MKSIDFLVWWAIELIESSNLRVILMTSRSMRCLGRMSGGRGSLVCTDLY